MAAAATGTDVGLKPIPEFDGIFDLWPRGRRPEAIREAAASFRERFARPDNRVEAVRSVDLASAAYPTKFAFGGAAKGPNPYINIINRLVCIQYEDFEGRPRTLVWEPTVAEGPAEAPFYQQNLERYGEFLAYRVFAKIWHDVPSALAEIGISAGEVDFVSFDHLHVQDPRYILGTREPIEGETVPRPPMFPEAKLIAQRREVDTFRDLHPMQWAWYVKDGWNDINAEKVLEIVGDVELGKGVALIWTPGHTDGNHSLVVNAPDGVWVSSENGVSSDNWHPHLSKIPGVRRWVEFFNREVVLNSNTLEDSIDQYDSMLKEKAVADTNRMDPRWVNVVPSSELAQLRRHWPVVPTHFYGGLNHGEIRAAR